MHNGKILCTSLPIIHKVHQIPLNIQQYNTRINITVSIPTQPHSYLLQILWDKNRLILLQDEPFPRVRLPVLRLSQDGLIKSHIFEVLLDQLLTLGEVLPLTELGDVLNQPCLVLSVDKANKD